MVLTVIVPQYSCSVPAISQPTEIDYAHRLFEIGKFIEAGEVYARIADQDSKNYPAVLQLGSIALLSNRLDDAQKWLEQAINPSARQRRCQSHARRGVLSPRAVPLLRWQHFLRAGRNGTLQISSSLPLLFYSNPAVTLG